MLLRWSAQLGLLEPVTLVVRRGSSLQPTGMPTDDLHLLLTSTNCGCSPSQTAHRCVTSVCRVAHVSALKTQCGHCTERRQRERLG